MRNPKDKNKSNIQRYIFCSIGVLIMMCICFVFLIFSTDVLYNVDTEGFKNNQMLFNRTSVSTVIEAVMEQEEAEDISDTNPVDIPINGKSWYEKISGTGKCTDVQSTITLSNGTTVNIYKDIPFAVDDYAGDVYYFNLARAKKDTETWWGSSNVSNSSWDYMFGTSKGNQCVTFGQDATPASSGITCLRVNLAPCFITYDYNNNFATTGLSDKNWLTRASTKDSYYGNGKGQVAEHPVVLVVKDLQSGGIGYLPVEPWAKAHTWPGGVFQTHVSIGKDYTTENTPTKFRVNTGDYGSIGWNHWHETTKETAWADYQTWCYGDDPSKPCKQYLKLSYELAYGCTEDCKILNGAVEVTGAIFWR